MSPLLVSPSSATASLSSSLGGQGDQGVHRGHGQAAMEEGAGRRDRQGEEKDSFLREAKERLQCLSGSPASLPEAPSLFLFTSSCSLSLSAPQPSLFFFSSLLSQAPMLSPLQAHSQTPHPSSVTVPKTWQRERQEQSFIFWPHPMREHNQSVSRSTILPRAHANHALPSNR